MENLIMKFSVNVKHVLLLHIESLLRLAFNIVVKKVLVMSLIDQPNAERKTHDQRGLRRSHRATSGPWDKS